MFLLEMVAKYGRCLFEKLDDVLREHTEIEGLRDFKDWDGGEAQKSDWWDNIVELVDEGLVVDQGEGRYALTHQGRSQLHSLVAASNTEKSFKVATRSLWVAMVALAVSLIVGVVL